MKPLVSILVPAFNAQEFVGDALASAINQTWPRKEIVVVDDGSTDATLDAIERAAAPNVRVVRQPHLGASAARNHALSLSHGDFIQWLDADDLLSPDKIERQLTAHPLPPTSRTLLSATWGKFFYRQSHARFIHTALWGDLPPIEWMTRKMERNLHMQTATWLVSRALTEASGPWDTTLSTDDDGEYFSRVVSQSDMIRFVPEARVFYRMTGAASLSYIGDSQAKIASQLRSMRMQIEQLRALEDSPRARAACVAYLQNSMGIFHPRAPDLVVQAERLAAQLGGSLELPRQAPKYSWVTRVFGATAGLKVQRLLPLARRSVVLLLDKALFRLEEWNS